MKIMGKVMLAAASVLSSAASWAGEVTIDNPSFEIPDFGVDGTFNFSIVDWTITGAGEAGTWDPAHSQTGCLLPDGFIDGVPDGDQVGYSNGSEISQQTDAIITPGHRYTLTVGVGGRCDFGGKPYALLLAGDTQVGATSGTQTSPLGGWIEVTVTYEPAPGDPNIGELLTVVLENQDGGQLNYDSIRLDDSVNSSNVGIDIKPGTDPNSINLCSNGAVPVAILGSDTFDVFTVDTDTLRFAGAATKVVGKKDPQTLCSYEDVNDDWIDDLVCHYVTTDIAGVDGETTSTTVSGELLEEFGGTPFEGTDSVKIVKDTCW